jgi:hypothetical protein
VLRYLKLGCHHTVHLLAPKLDPEVSARAHSPPAPPQLHEQHQ